MRTDYPIDLQRFFVGLGLFALGIVLGVSFFLLRVKHEGMKHTRSAAISKFE